MTTPSAEDVARRAKRAFEQSQTQLSSLESSAPISVDATGSSLKLSPADAARRSALLHIRKALEGAKEDIQRANAADVEAANELAAQGKLSRALVSRLDLFTKAGKWEAMLDGVEQVANLPSPLDVCTFAKRLAEQDSRGRGNLDLYRITCPIGVLLCIFEARPEVIVNIASLAIKSGNAAILKGGKESKKTAAVLSRVLSQALASTPALPADLVQTVETREEIAALLHQDRYIDLVIPRGSNELVRSIQREARMPVMGHADGLCIAYLHEDAVEELSLGTILDSKTDYPAACNALETLLIHRSHLSKSLWPAIAKALLEAGVTLHCDEPSLQAISSLQQNNSTDAAAKVVAAKPEDYDTEFLDLDLAVKVVDDVDAAIAHINEHGSHHTDLILCAPLSGGSSQRENPAAVRFTSSLSSANVYVNASTRFADGFRYGFGTEVGISTGRTHARGPVGLDGLVTYKYIVRGQGSQAQRAGDFNVKGEHGRAWSHTDAAAEYPTFSA